MADTTTTTTATVQSITPIPPTTAVASSLGADALKTEQDAMALYHAYKSGGLPAIVALASTLVPDVEKDYKDIKAAIPVVKVNYNNPAFWSTMLGVGIDMGFTIVGKEPPVDGVTVAAALLGIYTVVHGMFIHPTTVATTTTVTTK